MLSVPLIDRLCRFVPKLDNIKRKINRFMFICFFIWAPKTLLDFWLIFSTKSNFLSMILLTIDCTVKGSVTQLYERHSLKFLCLSPVHRCPTPPLSLCKNPSCFVLQNPLGHPSHVAAIAVETGRLSVSWQKTFEQSQNGF